MSYCIENGLLLIHGGAFKVYGKQKITLGSLVLVNLHNNNIEEIIYS